MYKKYPFRLKIYNTLDRIGFGRPYLIYNGKQQLVIKHMHEECQDLVEKYQLEKYPENPIPRKIWIMWYQGPPYPPIVNECIRRVTACRKLGYEVHVLDKNNLSDYIDIDDVLNMYNKADRHDKKGVSMQIVSDVIRMRLLYSHGGFWFDSTLLLTDPAKLNHIINNHNFFSIKFAQFDDYDSVTKGYVMPYFWATGEKNPFCSFVEKCIVRELCMHGHPIDYFAIEYASMIGYYNIPYIKRMIDLIQPSNPKVYSLTKLLDLPYDEKKYQELINSTYLFKLKWKLHPNKLNGGESTFWDYLEKEALK